MLDLLSDIPPLGWLAASYVGTVVSIWKLAGAIEKSKLVSKSGRRSTVEWLHELNPTRRLTLWSLSFESAFDSVFSERHLSWLCLRRSALATLIVMALILLVSVGTYSGSFSPVVATVRETPKNEFLGFIVFGIIVDYLSLLETRAILRAWRKSSFGNGAGVVLILDFFLTFVIYSLSFLVLWIFLHFWSGVDIINFDDPIELFVSLFLGILVLIYPLTSDDPFVRIAAPPFVYSTFFTSAWLWLHIFSGVLLRQCTRVSAMDGKLRRFFDTDSEPFVAIGAMSIVIVTVLYALAVPVVLLRG